MPQVHFQTSGSLRNDVCSQLKSAVPYAYLPYMQEDEQRSLVKCLDSAQLGVDTCLVDGLPALRDHLLSYIEAVSVSQTDDLELVRTVSSWVVYNDWEKNHAFSVDSLGFGGGS